MIVEPYSISVDSIEQGWYEAVEMLLKNGKRTGLILHIRKPQMLNPMDLAQYDPNSFDKNLMSLSDVANTIFPKPTERWNLPLASFSSYYANNYKRLHKRNPNSWGYYFQRLVEFGPKKINQLERVISKLNEWRYDYHAALVIHFSSADTDKPRPRGAPCLQYLQLGKTSANQLGMIVVYRSHDYFAKALGNFLGLTRLLHYICRKCGAVPGSITCLSSYAFLNGNKEQIRRMLKGGA